MQFYNSTPILREEEASVFDYVCLISNPRLTVRLFFIFILFYLLIYVDHTGLVLNHQNPYSPERMKEKKKTKEINQNVISFVLSVVSLGAKLINRYWLATTR